MTWGSMQTTWLDKNLNIAFVIQFSVRIKKKNQESVPQTQRHTVSFVDTRQLWERWYRFKVQHSVVLHNYCRLSLCWSGSDLLDHLSRNSVKFMLLLLLAVYFFLFYSNRKPFLISDWAPDNEMRFYKNTKWDIYRKTAGHVTRVLVKIVILSHFIEDT